MGRGDGLVIGGKVVLAACPDAFARLATGHRVVFVSATNGKTTTTRLLAAAMRAAGPVVTNDSGANMPAGIVAALARAPAAHAPSAQAAETPAVIEADETYLPSLLPGAHEPLLVLGNLSRDQLDRVGEVAMVARRWRKAFAATPGLAAVANADDPHVAWAAGLITDVTWVSVGQRWTADSALCPNCGEILRRADDPGWSCPSCGLSRPTPTWTLDAADTPIGTLVGPGDMRYPIALQLPGHANRANATMAVVAAQVLGVEPTTSLPAMHDVQSVGGRYQVVSIGGRQVRLLLGKNPAGWSEMFGMLAPAPAPVVIAINARAADGKDPSWLWDVPFEQLADRFVVATGERRHDLGVRLLYADVAHATVADPWAALPPEVGDAGRPDHPALDAVGTYTAFRELLRRAGGADDRG